MVKYFFRGDYMIEFEQYKVQIEEIKGLSKELGVSL